MRRFVPTPAMMLAIVAVVIAASGGATAATLITGQQIKDGSVTGRDIKNRSLTAKDFAGVLGVRAYATMRPDECFGPNSECTITA